VEGKAATPGRLPDRWQSAKAEGAPQRVIAGTMRSFGESVQPIDSARFFGSENPSNRAFFN